MSAYLREQRRELYSRSGELQGMKIDSVKVWIILFCRNWVSHPCYIKEYLSSLPCGLSKSLQFGLFLHLGFYLCPLHFQLKVLVIKQWVKYEQSLCEHCVWVLGVNVCFFICNLFPSVVHWMLYTSPGLLWELNSIVSRLKHEFPLDGLKWPILLLYST